jgi:phage-related protein
VRREIKTYKTPSGSAPVEKFFDKLTTRQVRDVAKVLRFVREEKMVPVTIWKKITSNLWEVRVRTGSDAIRILCFLDGGSLVILTSAFFKKTQQTPQNEIKTAEDRRTDYLSRK